MQGRERRADASKVVRVPRSTGSGSKKANDQGGKVVRDSTTSLWQEVEAAVTGETNPRLVDAVSSSESPNTVFYHVTSFPLRGAFLHVSWMTLRLRCQGRMCEGFLTV